MTYETDVTRYGTKIFIHNAFLSRKHDNVKRFHIRSLVAFYFQQYVCSATQYILMSCLRSGRLPNEGNDGYDIILQYGLRYDIVYTYMLVKV